ncbi:MAG: hypothetical protein HFG76_10030, partial [Hungatella sp.]|nr:hypothetical protein [Hungatella sp.]
MGIIQKKVTPEFRKWVGYCEKNRKDHLGTYDNPEHFKNNAGDGNYTVFADLYRQKTGINVQGQPWCDSFVDTVLIHLFGVEAARALLGGFSAYTPTSASFYKKMGRYHNTPQEGVLPKQLMDSLMAFVKPLQTLPASSLMVLK